MAYINYTYFKMETYTCFKTDETLHSENTLNGNQKHQNQDWILKLHYKNIPFR